MNSNASLFTPDYTHLTGFLKHLNVEELKDILNNDEKATEMINDLKQVKDIEAEREMLIASNRSISEYNLSKKPVIEMHEKQLEETRQRAIELKDKLLENKRMIESKSQCLSRDTLLALLQAATSEIEEEAEAVVEHFLKSELSIEDFLEKYLELRKLAHLRRIKAEKLAKMLQDGINQNGTVPEKPQRLRKPPAPPAPRPSLPHYPSPYPNVSAQSIPTVPVRQAPQPPMPGPQTFPYPPTVYFPNQNHSTPFTYVSPYMPQQPRYPPYK